MDKLQYDSFYKFLVSLGMLLITLPVLAYLYILNTNYKLISQNDYDNLSEISIQRMNDNLKLLDFTTTIMPVVSILLIVTGLVLIIIEHLITNVKYMCENYKSNTDRNCESVIVIVAPKEKIEKIQNCCLNHFDDYKDSLLENVSFEFFAEEDL